MSSKFLSKVIEITRMIPKGKVVSYGQIALMAGVPRAAIQIGWVLHQAGDDGVTPWWRVVNYKGRISTTCLEHTAWNQKALLEKEGIKVNKDLTLDINKYRFIPDNKVLNQLELDDEYRGMLLDRFGV